MLYGYIVKNEIRKTFDHVNNHRWDEAVKAVAPHVHHRVSGAHALGGERHDKKAMRRWFERLGRVLPNLHLTVNNIWVKGWPWHTTVFVSGTAPQRCSTATRRTPTVVSTCSPCGGVESMHSRNFKIHRKRPVGLPPKRQLASKKLSPNQL
jgi:SnoaL-like polyketide cyclase.